MFRTLRFVLKIRCFILISLYWEWEPFLSPFRSRERFNSRLTQERPKWTMALFRMAGGGSEMYVLSLGRIRARDVFRMTNELSGIEVKESNFIRPFSTCTRYPTSERVDASDCIYYVLFVVTCVTSMYNFYRYLLFVKYL